jgi:hypothetical protein
MDVVFLLHSRMRSSRWAYKYRTFAPPLRLTRDLTRGLVRAEAGSCRLRIKAERTEDVRCGHLRSSASSETLRKFFGAIS